MSGDMLCVMLVCGCLATVAYMFYLVMRDGK